MRASLTGVAIAGGLILLGAGAMARAGEPAASQSGGVAASQPAAVPASQPTGVAASQPAAGAATRPAATQPQIPPRAAALLTLIRQVAPGQSMPSDPRMLTEYLVRTRAARTAIAQLRRDWPEVAARPEVRIAELAILFDSAYLNSDLEMKDLRHAIARALDDPASPRLLRAMAEYHQLNADMVVRSRREPASQPDAAPSWLAEELNRRADFARRFKDLPIGRQAFAEAITYKDNLDGYAKTAGLVDEFIKTFPDDKPAQATLLGELASIEFARDRDGWAAAKPIVDRLLKEYHDQPVTPQTAGWLASKRMGPDFKSAMELVDRLTADYPGDESVARCWGQLAERAFLARDDKLLVARLKVLTEKFPASSARCEALATVAWLTYRENGLDGTVRTSLAELVRLFPRSAIVARVHVMVAQSQIEKVGLEKARPFVNGVLRQFAGSEEIRQLEDYVRQVQPAASQPAG